MEKREPKDLSIYDKRFEEDPSSFNDFQAMDYVKELKNQGRNDEAIEAIVNDVDKDKLNEFLKQFE